MSEANFNKHSNVPILPNNPMQNQNDNDTPMQIIYDIINMFNKHDYKNKHENQHIYNA